MIYKEKRFGKSAAALTCEHPFSAAIWYLDFFPGNRRIRSNRPSSSSICVPNSAAYQNKRYSTPAKHKNTAYFHIEILHVIWTYPVSQKKLWSRTLASTLSNLNRFQKFLHCCKENEISNKPCVIILTTP